MIGRLLKECLRATPVPRDLSRGRISAAFCGWLGFMCASHFRVFERARTDVAAAHGEPRPIFSGPHANRVLDFVLRCGVSAPAPCLFEILVSSVIAVCSRAYPAARRMRARARPIFSARSRTHGREMFTVKPDLSFLIYLKPDLSFLRGG